MNAEEAQLWRDVVNELAVNWFTQGDIPLMKAYVSAAVQHRRISEECRTAPFTIVNTHGNSTANPLFAVQARLVQTMSAAATKLRLTTSTRIDKHKASTVVEHEQRKMTGTNDAGPRRPWDK